jgi:hypothetical protein
MTRTKVLIWKNAVGDEIASNVCPAGHIAAMEVFTEEQTRGNVLSLMRRINATHLSPNVGVVVTNRYETEHNLAIIKMESTESVVAFHRRFL